MSDSILKPLAALALLTACAAPIAAQDIQAFPDSAFIYWNDGDSGWIRGIEEPIPFRIHGVDTPETGGIGAAVGGALCEQERALGYDAKAWAVAHTDGADIAITRDYGPDSTPSKRLVVDLSIDGIDYGDALILSGHGKPWDYDGGQPKPGWCS